MKDPTSQHILRFLREYLYDNKPILLGLSGGTDSLALFYLLLECQKEISFNFGVAHIDHGWRSVSSKEASILKNLVEKHSLPFHLKTLNHTLPNNNLEAKYRVERISFFKELFREHGYQALLLAHQLDDQAETVLKNLFEGSNLIACNGIAERVKMDSLEIWRPLLKISKKQLSAWLSKKGIVPFTDETNTNPKFLRARMRQEIIPHLETLFGKGIIHSLASIGTEAQELKEFMLIHFSEILKAKHSGPMGTYLDLTPHKNLSLYEIKFLIRHVCGLEACFPSKGIVENAAVHLINCSSNKEFVMGEYRIFVDRGLLFVTSSNLFTQISRMTELSKNENLHGAWRVKIEKYMGPQVSLATNWKELWLGKGEVLLPPSDLPYSLGPSQLNESYDSTTLHKWWNQNKIPTFLRKSIPVIRKGNTIEHEFLTGKAKSASQKNDCMLKITLIGRE
jgi:tRNA(Ile)-lysidine synthase